jgi:hypothetical protein
MIIVRAIIEMRGHRAQTCQNVLLPLQATLLLLIINSALEFTSMEVQDY